MKTQHANNWGAPVVVMENHSTALAWWRYLDIRSGTLVHVDAHPDIALLPPGGLETLAAVDPLTMQSYEADLVAYTRSGLYDLSNFLYPAIRLKLFRRVIWVIPDHMAVSPEQFQHGIERLFKEDLAGIPIRDWRSIQWNGCSCHLSLFGASVTICRMRDLPFIPEPVTLDIDLDFFLGPVIGDQLPSLWCTPSELCTWLYRRIRQVTVITVSYSVKGGYVPPQYRPIGYALLRELGDPLQLTGPQTPVDRSWGMANSEAYTLGRFWLRHGRPDRAAVLLLDAESNYPELPGTAFLIGQVLHALGDAKQAMEWYREAMRRRPDESVFANNLAVVLAENGHLEEAECMLRRAVSLRSWYAEAYFNLGQVLFQLGSLREAYWYLRRAVCLHPLSGTYRFWLATVCEHLGQTEAALRHYRVIFYTAASPRLRKLAAARAALMN